MPYTFEELAKKLDYRLSEAHYKTPRSFMVEQNILIAKNIYNLLSKHGIPKNLTRIISIGSGHSEEYLSLLCYMEEPFVYHAVDPNLAKIMLTEFSLSQIKTSEHKFLCLKANDLFTDSQTSHYFKKNSYDLIVLRHPYLLSNLKNQHDDFVEIIKNILPQLSIPNGYLFASFYFEEEYEIFSKLYSNIYPNIQTTFIRDYNGIEFDEPGLGLMQVDKLSYSTSHRVLNLQHQATTKLSDSSLKLKKGFLLSPKQEQTSKDPTATPQISQNSKQIKVSEKTGLTRGFFKSKENNLTKTQLMFTDTSSDSNPQKAFASKSQEATVLSNNNSELKNRFFTEQKPVEELPKKSPTSIVQNPTSTKLTEKTEQPLIKPGSLNKPKHDTSTGAENQKPFIRPGFYN
jgi:hypothetical protein